MEILLMRGFQTHMAEATHPHELSFHQEAFQNRARAMSLCSTADMVALHFSAALPSIDGKVFGKSAAAPVGSTRLFPAIDLSASPTVELRAKWTGCSTGLGPPHSDGTHH
jgi:hypothetical protein